MINFTDEQKLKYLNYILGEILCMGGPENLDGQRLRNLVYSGDYKRYEIKNFNLFTEKMNEKYNLDMSYIADYFREIKIFQIIDPV
jgi:hypothetical protein